MKQINLIDNIRFKNFTGCP